MQQFTPVFEVFLILPDRTTWTGYFTGPEQVIAALDAYRGPTPTGVYILPNPINPLPTQAPNRLAQGVSRTADAEVSRRHWLLIDFDPRRPSGTSSTDAEHAAAGHLAKAIRAALSQDGWPKPVFADSGNGAHLLYLLDLPNDDDAKWLFKSVLQGLSARFGTAEVEVDPATFNAGRLTKLYGTGTAKGANIADRPHRTSRLIMVPDQMATVSRDQLQAVADWKAPREPQDAQQQPSTLPLTIGPTATDAADDEPVESERLLAALKHIPADHYEDWLKVGVSLHHYYEGKAEGLEVWDRWAKTTGADNYDPEAGAAKWRGFGKSSSRPATAATVLYLAKEHGWDAIRREPVRKAFGSNGHATQSTAQSTAVPTPGTTNALAIANPQMDLPTQWPEPQQPDADLPPVTPFSPQLLPDALRAWVQDVSERMQCAMDFVAVGIMVGLAAVVGRQVAIRPKAKDSWTVIANLWAAVIAPPGSLKTPALQEAIWPVEHLERQAWAAHQDALALHALAVGDAERRARAAEKCLQKAEDAGFGQGKSVSIDDVARAREVMRNPLPAEPRAQRYLVHDTTIEALGVILEANPRGVLMLRDELAGFLRSMDRDGHECDRAFYLEAWNGSGSFSHDRIGRGHLHIDAACVSVLGGIQPEPFTAYMASAARAGADNDGLVQRFQLLVWPDRPALCPPVDRAPNLVARQQALDLFQALDHLDVARLGATVADGELPYLRFHPEAQRRFYDWLQTLLAEIASGNLPSAVANHLDKYRSLVPSLALLIHLADDATGPVSEAALDRAIGWTDYLRSHLTRIYAPVMFPLAGPVKAISERIQAGDLGTQFTVRELSHKKWANIGTDTNTVREAVDELVELGWLCEHTERTGGRPRTWFEVNPKALPSTAAPQVATVEA